TSSYPTRPATTATATGWRWTACFPAAGCGSHRARARRDSTPSCTRRTGRTSSCRRGRTGRSHSQSSRRSALAEEGPRHVVPLLGHGLQLARRLLERHVHDRVALQRSHPAEVALVDEVRRL